MTTRTKDLWRKPQRFPAANRVTQSRDFLRSRAHGRRVSTRTFTLEVTPNASATRLGLVVSRRVGGAVERNRVKRRVREWFRTGHARMPTALDLVVIARTGAGALGTAALREELNALIERATQ